MSLSLLFPRAWPAERRKRLRFLSTVTETLPHLEVMLLVAFILEISSKKFKSTVQCVVNKIFLLCALQLGNHGFP